MRSLGRGDCPLRVGQQVKACKNVLFCNPGEKILTILAGDVVGHAQLVGQGTINPEWRQAMESLTLVHSMDKGQPTSGSTVPERTQQLIEQLGLMENKLLAWHPKVRSNLISLLTRYETVFTDSDVAVGKTDVLKIRIVLDPGATPVRAPVRRI